MFNVTFEFGGEVVERYYLVTVDELEHLTEIATSQSLFVVLHRPSYTARSH